MSSTQVDDFGDQIPRDSAGKILESHRILKENIGNRWNMEAVFRPETVRIFFRWIPANFLCFPAGTGRKKSEKFSAGILLPQNHQNYPEPPVSGPYSSTWEVIDKTFVFY